MDLIFPLCAVFNIFVCRAVSAVMSVFHHLYVLGDNIQKLLRADAETSLRV